MTFPKSIFSLSATDTESAGRELANRIMLDSSLPRFVALFGDLGVGKTAFARGFTSVISPDARVKSPTFSLVNHYKGQTTSVFHFDMYRIENEDDLYSIGFFDYVDNGICLVEWSENIENVLPENAFFINISKGENDESRIFEIEGDERLENIGC